MTRRTAVALAATVATSVVCVGAAGPTRPAATSRPTCPDASSLTRQPETIEGVVRATRRLVPRTYAGSHGFVVQYVAWLGDDFHSARGLRAAAQAACGARVARLSWGVGLQFPAAPTASASFSQAVLTHTRTGWRLWLRRG